MSLPLWVKTGGAKAISEPSTTSPKGDGRIFDLAASRNAVDMMPTTRLALDSFIPLSPVRWRMKSITRASLQNETGAAGLPMPLRYSWVTPEAQSTMRVDLISAPRPSL